MATFTLYTNLAGATEAGLDGLINSLLAQTNQDWNLVLVVPKGDSFAPSLASRKVSAKISWTQGLQDDHPEWALGRELATAGTWVGVVGHSDRLLPGALEAFTGVSTLAAYTDAARVNRGGMLTMPFIKRAINPLRLRHQNYLPGLLLIQKQALLDLGGYQRMAVDMPTHDLCLRLLDAHGPGAFTYIPQTLYLFHRDLRDPWPGILGFDRYGVLQHLGRHNLEATLLRHQGELFIRPQPPVYRGVSLIVALPEYQRDRLQHTMAPAPFQPEETFFLEPEEFTPTKLNEIMRRVNSTHACFLKGEAINSHWLAHLMNYGMQPGISAAGACLTVGSALAQPGLSGFSYKGKAWSFRGPYNCLSQPSTVSALSGNALVVDTADFLGIGGLNQSLSTLAFQDLCLRLPGSVAYVPQACVSVDDFGSHTPEELARFAALHPGWQDPWGFQGQ